MNPSKTITTTPIDDRRVVALDCFGLFAPDPFVTYFHQKLGATFSATKDRLCRPGDLGEITYEEFLLGVEEETGDPASFLRQMARDIAKPNMKMFELCKRIRTVRPVYLLSNAMSGMMNEYFRGLDLASYFDACFISNEMHLIKPTAESYEYMLRHIKRQAYEVYFYDDNQTNVNAANAVGIHGILFTSIEDLERDLLEKGLLK